MAKVAVKNRSHKDMPLRLRRFPDMSQSLNAHGKKHTHAIPPFIPLET
jgi:hypothetical protein